jgi:hypothetical protein
MVHSALRSRGHLSPGDGRWQVVDLCSLGQLDPARFFRPIPAPLAHGAAAGGGARLTLEKDRFYVLATKEVGATLSRWRFPGLRVKGLCDS